MPLARLAWAAAALLLFVAPAGAGVVVVDPGGGPGIELLKQALNSAADGDVILLREGIYVDTASFPYPVQVKGLTIQPAPGVGRLVTNAFQITQQPAGKTVVLRGLQLGLPDGLNHTFSLNVQFTAASVWVEDCLIYGAKGWLNDFFSAQPGLPAVFMDTALGGSLTLVRCTVVGGAGQQEFTATPFKATSGGPAVHLGGARLALHECSVTGGRAGNGDTGFGLAADGGDGIVVKHSVGGTSATLLVSGCSVTGGAEGVGPVAGRSGSGLFCQDAFAALRERDSTFAPGAVVGPGLSGLPIIVVPGTLLSFAAPSRSLELPAALVAGQPGVLHVDGQPDDGVLVLVSTGAGYLDWPAKQGVLSLALSPVVGPLFVGTIGGAGVLDLPFTLPAPPAGLDEAVLLLQCATMSGGSTTLGSGSSLLWLAAAP